MDVDRVFKLTDEQIAEQAEADAKAKNERLWVDSRQQRRARLRKQCMNDVNKDLLSSMPRQIRRLHALSAARGVPTVSAVQG